MISVMPRWKGKKARIKFYFGLLVLFVSILFAFKYWDLIILTSKSEQESNELKLPEN